MQSIDSWGGVYRFPLNLARIGAHLLHLGHTVQLLDLQADIGSNLYDTLTNFRPDLCILSSGFPSMRVDSHTAGEIKTILPTTHVSTFGVAPTLLKERFFDSGTWGFEICFDSVVVGGEPALGYESILIGDLNKTPSVVKGAMQKIKSINTQDARYLFDHSLYKSPFTGENATYIEGTYGCPFRCSFCVVPELYEGKFSKRTPEDIVGEFKFVLENNDVSQITLWDEGTTFQKSFIRELCDGLIELRKSNNSKFKNFLWTTRSTTSLLDEEIVEKLALSGLSGITLGIESFDEIILESIEKNISLETNQNAIRLLSKFGIVSIGHIILGHINDTRDSIEKTISSAVDSNLNFAQFYCSVPYPGTKLSSLAIEHDLIRIKDLTKYELSNPIMDTLGGVSYLDVGRYRTRAMKLFWTDERWRGLNKLIKHSRGIGEAKKEIFLGWKSKTGTLTAAHSRGMVTSRA
jgi:radical SAM superfamily enzyme YgiQ (UPF0313 family)